MSECSDKIATVVDYGNHVELALRLSREFKKVNYFRWWKDDRPVSTKLAVGDGFPEITRIRHLFDWSVMSETDIFIFPEIYDGDLQLDLERRGKKVWGSRRAERYEYDRPLFLKTLKEVGLPVPEYKIATGMSELKRIMADNDDLWIKVNLRGDDETWHHINWNMSQRKLESMEYRYGPLKEDIEFTCVWGIDSRQEAAYDGFLVTSPDGKPQFPEIAFQGYEVKSRAHILAAIDYDKLADPIKEVNAAFAPVLAKKFYRSAWGTEIKITDDSFIFLDATCRQPDPPGPILLEQIKNLGEFIWHGSEGELIPLEIEKPFGAQVALFSSWGDGNYQPFEIPEEIRRWVKVYGACQTKEGIFGLPQVICNPAPNGNESVAVIIGLGDTVEEAIDAVKENCEGIEAFDTTPAIDALAEALSRIHQGQEEGVHFGNKPIPEPASILE